MPPKMKRQNAFIEEQEVFKDVLIYIDPQNDKENSLIIFRLLVVFVIRMRYVVNGSELPVNVPSCNYATNQ